MGAWYVVHALSISFLSTSVSYPNSLPKSQAWTSARYRTLGESAARPASSVQLGARTHTLGRSYALAAVFAYNIGAHVYAVVKHDHETVTTGRVTFGL